MGIKDTAFRTIICNGPACSKTVTFQQTQEAQAEAFAKEGNEWLKATRIISTPDGRSLAYCSDICEVKGIETGAHNLPEPKRIIDGVASQAQVQAAAEAAQRAEQATAAIKAGQPVTL